jgi:hypothetical protein
MTSKLAEREAELRSRFGDLLTLKDLAPLLRYPSVEAVRKARTRGQLPVTVVRIAHRRGWFATPRSVAEFLEALETSATSPEGEL